MHRKQTVYRRYETKSRSTLPDYIGVIEQYRERRKVLNPINRTANSRSTARRETLPDGVTTSVSRFVV